MQEILCGWYGYLGVMGALVALSAGPRTVVGRLALAAAAVAFALIVTLFRSIPGGDASVLAAKVFVLAAGVAALATGPRTDTRLIALLFTGAAVLPLYLHLWRP